MSFAHDTEHYDMIVDNASHFVTESQMLTCFSLIIFVWKLHEFLGENKRNIQWASECVNTFVRCLLEATVSKRSPPPNLRVPGEPNQAAKQQRQLCRKQEGFKSLPERYWQKSQLSGLGGGSSIPLGDPQQISCHPSRNPSPCGIRLEYREAYIKSHI